LQQFVGNSLHVWGLCFVTIQFDSLWFIGLFLDPFRFYQNTLSFEQLRLKKVFVMHLLSFTRFFETTERSV